MTRRKTPTGRFSSFRPRYQNIPIRSGEEPARLSDGVKAAILGTIPPHPALPDAPPLDEAIDLVVFDYSILEMRVAAVMAERDPKPTTPTRPHPRLKHVSLVGDKRSFVRAERGRWPCRAPSSGLRFDKP